jgi:hypothetical protein
MGRGWITAWSSEWPATLAIVVVVPSLPRQLNIESRKMSTVLRLKVSSRPIQYISALLPSFSGLHIPGAVLISFLMAFLWLPYGMSYGTAYGTG